MQPPAVAAIPCHRRLRLHLAALLLERPPALAPGSNPAVATRFWFGVFGVFGVWCLVVWGFEPRSCHAGFFFAFLVFWCFEVRGFGILLFLGLVFGVLVF